MTIRSPPTRRGVLGGGMALAAGACLPRATDPAPHAASREHRGALVDPTPRTRFACNIEMWFTGLPWVERVDAAADLGFPAVEFWGWQGRDLQALGARCRARGVEVAQFTAWGFSPGLNDPAHHGTFAAAVEDAIAVAADLGASKATVVGGNDRPGVPRVEMHEQIRAGLSRVASRVEAAGLMLILEPMNLRVDHPGHCLWGSPEAVAICRAVGSPQVKLNWDLYHMQISEGDLCGRLAEGFDQVGYLQLADHPGRHEPGTGEIHFPRVLRAAWELGYRGYVGLECSPARGEVQAAEAVRRADAW